MPKVSASKEFDQVDRLTEGPVFSGRNDEKFVSNSESKQLCENLSYCVSIAPVKGNWNDDEWNKRVVVKRREDLSREELKKLPWARPSVELYKKVTDAIHSLSMIKVNLFTNDYCISFCVEMIELMARIRTAKQCVSV